MLLALDIGNSTISVGVFDLSHPGVCPESPVHTFKISAKGLSADEYALQIYSHLRIRNIAPSEKSEYFSRFDKSFSHDALHVNHGVIASVVPSMTDVLASAVGYLTGETPFIIASGVKTGFGIRIKNPEQLGADIVANTAYAVDTVPAPFVILDVGTATTITVVDRQKNLLGTVIMPGLRVSLQALAGSAAQLSDIPLTAPQVLIGRDSSESVRSGVINGHCLMVDGFIRNIREEYGAEEKLSLMATGGLAHIILPHMRNKFTNIPSLTLLGAAKIYLLNHKNQRGEYKFV